MKKQILVVAAMAAIVASRIGHAHVYWGQELSVPNMVKVLSFAKEVANDYGNGDRFVAPKSFFCLAVELTENSHRDGGIYKRRPALPELVCTGMVRESINLAIPDGHHRNFTKAIPHLMPPPLQDIDEQQQSKRIKPAKVSMAELFDRLFLCQGPAKTKDTFGLNFLWVSWVNFYFEDSL